MSHSPAGPGKTAPKIYQDFLLFDPLCGVPNILIDNPIPAGDDRRPLAPPLQSCKHDYTTKTVQSVLPPLDLRPDGTTHHKLAAICKKCRIHAEIEVNYAQSTNACPNSEYPLHHFQRLVQADEITSERIRYCWQCSAPQCRAYLYISYRLHKISNEEQKRLTNPELLKQRYEVLVQREPNREGVREATSMEALNRLRKYIRDSLNPEHQKRSFPANNKRFMEAFGYLGQDCGDILERLGFSYTDPNWSLPNPPTITDRLQADGSSLREFLEDAELELTAWMYTIASQTGLVNPAASEGWPSAHRDIERTLGAQGYNRHMPMRRGPVSNEDLRYFASLGAPPDFSDSLILFVYDRQTLCDPTNLSYYFECLQVISESRGTEALQIKVATLQSQDLISRRDLSVAYRNLGIDMNSSRMIPDERVLEIFQARQSDLGPSAAEEARQALNKIGISRQSQTLLRASRQSIDTYEDALAWLGNGVTKDTADEAIIAVLAIRVGDSAAEEELGRRAVSVIARTRQSNMLNNWLTTGRAESDTMSVDEALRHLAIETDIREMDQTILPVLFDNARADRPGELTEKAIATIQQALANMNETPTHSPENWPVGLTSHGNTCYLNSLLQYYFSIKPLRDIVLDYDKYKLDTTTYENDGKKEQRVGGLQVELVVIKGGQRFAEDLKHLFERMIKDPSSAVKPEEDLVCRAFLHPRDYALLASSIRDQAALSNGVEEEAVEEPLIDLTGGSDASSATLPVNGEDNDISMKDKDLPPTPPASPGHRHQEELTEPPHAPPLPPRRFTSTKEEALSKAQEKARQQQDVTEVHDAVMFRLRSGMTPQGVDDDEQIDAIRDLFSIRMVETTVKNGVIGKSKPLSDVTVQLNVPSEPVDIYSALDGFFDLQSVAESPEIESFRSIKTLPPMLQISIPRIGYGASGAFKSTDCVRLEDELYVDRYMDNPDILPQRRACWKWRKTLRALQREQRSLDLSSAGLDGPTSIIESANFLESIASTDRLLEDLGVEGVHVDEKLRSTLKSHAGKESERASTLGTEIEVLENKLKGQFDEMKNKKYRLAAVFIHRGTHGHGHYWIYIHDFTNGIWRSYNDERVEEYKKLEDIFEAKTWEQGTPTYAVYVQDELKEQYIQPVCRAIEQRPLMSAPTSSPAPSLKQGTSGSWKGMQAEDASTHQTVEAGQHIEMSQGGDVKMTSEGEEHNWDKDRQEPRNTTW